MDFEEEYQQKRERVEVALARCFPVAGDCPGILSGAMAYSVMAGGKRLRPVLLLSACEALGGDTQKALPFACALEMIHTYSLIHDDLPAMDNDDLRRGRPTSHKIYGEAMAILAGDGLLSYAFERMANASRGDQAGVLAMGAIAAGAGVNGMVAGQVEDIRSEGATVDQELLAYIHVHKTAALLQGALLAGGYLAGASEAQTKVLSEAGLHLGMAFQIQDDILDVTGDTTALGKPVHSDEKNQKNTYVNFYGLKGASRLAGDHSTQAAALFRSLGPESEFLVQLTKYLTSRKQ